MSSPSFSSSEAAAAAAAAGTRPPSILPKAIIFDLDATLWTPELFEMSGRPFRRLERAGKGKGKGKKAPPHHHIVVDRRGSQIDLFPEARLVLEELATCEKWEGVTLGLASRTDCVQDAHELLEMIHITPTLTMADLFPRPVRQIFPGNKRTHFQNLHKDTGIPFRDMAFWDDWDLNCRDVSKLGVHCFHVPSGLNLNRWQKALEKYAEKKAEEGW